MSEWINIIEADTYFLTRAGATDWISLSSTEKQAYLTTAFNRLEYSNKYNFPTSPTTDELTILKMAQCEMAWYMKIHIEDEDSRKGIQAQGVVSAGIVSESYNVDMLTDIVIPGTVVRLLRGFKSSKKAVMLDIYRDDDYSVNSTEPVSDLDLEG